MKKIHKVNQRNNLHKKDSILENNPIKSNKMKKAHIKTIPPLKKEKKNI